MTSLEGRGGGGNSPRGAVGQRSHENEQRELQQSEDANNHRALHTQVGVLRRFRGCIQSTVRNRVVDGFGADEVENGPSNQGGSEVGGEIVVQEELPTEEEEGDVVHHPYHDEEATRIPQTMGNGCKQK